MKRLLPLLSVAILGCSESSESPQNDAGVDLAEDVGSDLTTDMATEDMAPPGPYVVEKSQVVTSELGTRRGYRVARGIIHAHAVHSHDACDGEPEVDGQPNEPCLQDFRDAICITKQDFVFMTDHEELASEKDFDTLLMIRGDDETMSENNIVIANQMACDDGFRPLLMPGGEFGTMPVGMTRHIDGTIAERTAIYEQETPEAVAALKDVGAVVLQAHAESRSLDELRDLNLDGFEVYQLHANVDPTIRQEFLGLSGAGWAENAGPFIRRQATPDLVFLSFFSANQPSLSRFDTLVSEGQKLVGTGGTDCHQNVANLDLGDGERMDSYRRMMRWFSNHLLVPEVTPTNLKEALRDGRLYIAFEVLGTPQGFDYRAEAAGETAEIGGTVRLSDSPTLYLDKPTVHAYGAVPTTQKILKIEATGAVVVATGEDALEFRPSETGAYRAVVEIQPTHLTDALGPDAQEFAERTYEWVWANPIYVE